MKETILMFAAFVAPEPQQTVDFAAFSKLENRVAVLEKKLADLNRVETKSAPAPIKTSESEYSIVRHWMGCKVQGDEDSTCVSVATDAKFDPVKKEWHGYVISLNRDEIYLNGERYSPTNKFTFSDRYSEELSMWYAWTGPCELAVKNGAYHFRSLEGSRLEKVLDESEQWATSPDWRKDLVYDWFRPRLRTMTECRKAWAEWNRTHPGGWDGKPPAGKIRTDSYSTSAPVATPTVSSNSTIQIEGRTYQQGADGVYRAVGASTFSSGYSASPVYSSPSCTSGNCYSPSPSYSFAPTTSNCSNGRCYLPNR